MSTSAGRSGLRRSADSACAGRARSSADSTDEPSPGEFLDEEEIVRLEKVHGRGRARQDLVDQIDHRQRARVAAREIAAGEYVFARTAGRDQVLAEVHVRIAGEEGDELEPRGLAGELRRRDGG